MSKILVTGGFGFIGSHFIRDTLASRPDVEIVNLDLLTYAGNEDNLRDGVDGSRLESVRGSIGDRALVDELFSRHGFDAVVHFAAESHVDRSIDGPDAFVQTNVAGTQVLLDVSLQHWRTRFDQVRFVHVSTDEVYGSLGPDGLFTEQTPLAPNSPYSASKAASDCFVRAYFHTFGLPVLTTRCSNNYGSYQYPEKFMPLMILNALHDRPLPVYGDGMYVRDWLHVSDHCSAIARVWEQGRPGEVYNIGGNNQQYNIEVLKRILAMLDKPESLIRHVTDRPGHDRRYAISAEKIRQELGWEPSVAFSDGLERTVRWYVDNRWWWEKLYK